jgi:hypothetical protein
MPQLGRSIAEATIVDIKVKPGDEVVTDQEIIDVETKQSVMGVTTPVQRQDRQNRRAAKGNVPSGRGAWLRGSE